MQLDSTIKYLFPQHLLCTRVEPLPTVCSNMNIVYKVHARESSKYNFSVCAGALAVCVCVWGHRGVHAHKCEDRAC